MKYTLRLMVFVLKTLVLVLVVSALLVMGFTFAMDASNIYIVAHDGMQMRAEVTLGIESSAELSKFFTPNALVGDPQLSGGVYADYDVRSIDYRGEIEWLWAWPWNDKGQVRLLEHIPTIEGSLPVAKQSAEQLDTPGKILPPAWQDARYELAFIKEDGHWKIDGVALVEKVEPLPTKAPQNMLPATDAPSTATPTPTAPTPEQEGDGQDGP